MSFEKNNQAETKESTKRKREENEVAASGTPSMSDAAGVTPNTPNGGTHKKPKVVKAKRETEQSSSSRNNQAETKESTKRKRENSEPEQTDENEAVVSSSSLQDTDQATSFFSATHKKAKKEEDTPAKQETEQPSFSNRKKMKAEKVAETKEEMEIRRCQELEKARHKHEQAALAARQQAMVEQEKTKSAPERETKETKQSTTISSSSSQPFGGNTGLQSTSSQMAAVEWTDALLSDLPHALLSEVLQGLKPVDLVNVALASKAMNEAMKDEMVWRALLEKDFKCTLPKRELPHLLDAYTIHRHLRAHSKVDREDINLFTENDPALFKSALEEGEEASLLSREQCLYKAACVGNIALVQWLMDEARGDLRVLPHAGRKKSIFDESTLEAAIKSGYLPLVKMLMESGLNPEDVSSKEFLFNTAAATGSMELIK